MKLNHAPFRPPDFTLHTHFLFLFQSEYGLTEDQVAGKLNLTTQRARSSFPLAINIEPYNDDERRFATHIG